MPSSPAKTALLLIAHGSRRPEANVDLEFIAAEMTTRGRFDVIHISYLELAEPTIAEGGAKCVEQGATTVIMLPYFLSPGVHVREDMIEVRDELTTKFPHVVFKLAHHLGRHPMMLDIVEQRAMEVL